MELRKRECQHERGGLEARPSSEERLSLRSLEDLRDQEDRIIFPGETENYFSDVDDCYQRTAGRVDG